GHGGTLLVFDSMTSILESEPAQHALPAPPASLALGRLDEDQLEDLAIVANGQVLILHGIDKSGDEDILPGRKAGRLEQIALPFAVSAMALGEFIWDRDGRVEMAMLAQDGSIRIVAQGELDTRPITAEEILKMRRRMVRDREKGENERKRDAREAMTAASIAAETLTWGVVEDLSPLSNDTMTASARVSDGLSPPPLLLSTRISAQPTDDKLIMNPAAGRVQVMYKPGPKAEDDQVSPQSVERSSVAIEADGELVAALPMRLSVDGRPGLVVLGKGQTSPGFFVPLVATTFTVTRSDDPAPSGCVVGDCSLREAVIAANANAGADTIVFNAGVNPVLSRTGTDNAASLGDLDINDSVTIMGNGSGSTLINTTYVAGCGDCKVFGVNQDGTHQGMT